MELEKSLFNGALVKPGLDNSGAGSNVVEVSDDKRVAKAQTGMDFSFSSNTEQDSNAQRKRIEMIEAARSRFVTNAQARLQIDREEDAGRFIYKLQNLETGEVVRQWPPENYVDLIAFLAEKRGGVVNKTA